MAKTSSFSWFAVLAIVLTGTALGLAHNRLGLAGQPPRGLPWIATDSVSAMPTLTLDDGAPADYTTDNPDPMALPATAAGLPEIPDLDRPIRIDLGGLKRFVDRQAILVVDARDAGEYSEGHLPGAVNLPYDDVVTDPARLEALDTGGRPIVTYCGGGSCELSLKLAEELLLVGHRRVLVYLGGFPEWAAAGYPVVSGESR